MPTYEWVGQGEYRDNRNDRVVETGETIQLEKRVGNPHPELVEVETEEDVSEPETQGVASEDEGVESDESEDVPLEEKEYSELRDMAVEADTDEINGRSSASEIISYFQEA